MQWVKRMMPSLRVAVCILAVLVMVALAIIVITWPAVTNEAWRIILISFGSALQGAGAYLVIRNVIAQERLDRNFLRRLNGIDDTRKEQRTKLDKIFAPPPPTRAPQRQRRAPTGAVEMFAAQTGQWHGVRLPKEQHQAELHRIGQQRDVQTAVEYSANNLGDVLPMMNEAVTDYLRARAEATTTDRWIGVVLLVLGLVVSLLSGIVGTLA